MRLLHFKTDKEEFWINPENINHLWPIATNKCWAVFGRKGGLEIPCSAEDLVKLIMSKGVE